MYKTFADVEEKKFSALIDGKSEAASKAFDLLKSEDSGLVDASSFRGLMKEYKPLTGNALIWIDIT